MNQHFGPMVYDMFYLDGRKFIHKLHPEDQAWAPEARFSRRKDEGLNLDSAVKAKKYVGKLAHFSWLSHIQWSCSI